MFGNILEGRVKVNEGDCMQGKVGLRWVRVKMQKQIPSFSKNFIIFCFENMWGIATETRNPEQIPDIWVTSLGG